MTTPMLDETTGGVRLVAGTKPDAKPVLAVFLPNWVGDVVMCTPALRALRQHFPQVLIVAVYRRYLAELLAGCPWFDDAIASDDFWPMVRQLRSRQATWGLLFPNSLRAALAAWLGGCRNRIGYRRDGRSWLLTEALDWPAIEKGRRLPYPVLLAYNRLAQRLGCPDPGVQMQLFTTPEQEAAAERIWQKRNWQTRPVVALHPGAAYGSAKCWPVDYFAELARRLAWELACGVLVLCGPAERKIAQEIEKLSSHPQVYGLHHERIDLGLVKACLKRVAMLITTDSGPRHIAVAFDRPVVTIFGPTHIAWTETFHPRSLHLQQIVSCGPCQLRRCPRDHRCMRELTPEFVFEQACSWLHRWRDACTVPLETVQASAAFNPGLNRNP
jgi:heptosyltransferase-2